MPVIIYQNQPQSNTAFEQFLFNLRSSQLRYLASDLLEKGLTPADITAAIQRAMLICKTGNQPVVEHFQPIYTYYNGAIINDCRLSNLGYALVLLNANAKYKVVAEWQLELLDRSFSV